jgi:hypothetical protein
MVTLSNVRQSCGMDTSSASSLLQSRCSVRVWTQAFHRVAATTNAAGGILTFRRDPPSFLKVFLSFALLQDGERQARRWWQLQPAALVCIKKRFKQIQSARDRGKPYQS